MKLAHLFGQLKNLVTFMGSIFYEGYKIPTRAIYVEYGANLRLSAIWTILVTFMGSKNHRPYNERSRM